MTDHLIELSVERPDQALFDESRDVLLAAKHYDITSPSMALDAGDDLVRVKALQKKIEVQRVAITGPLNKALKEVNALFKPAKDWLAEAERLLKSEILGYQQAEAHRQRVLQAKADEDARKERESLERKAKVADVIGIGDKAEELRAEAELAVAPVIESEAPKLAGVSVRKTWKALVTDRRALLSHILEVRPDLLSLVTLDQAGLNALARIHKAELDLPGVKAVEEESVAARS